MPLPTFVSNIDSPRLSRFASSLQWDEEHAHFLMTGVVKTHYAIDRTRQYVIKITGAQRSSFLQEVFYFNQLRRKLGKMIPNSIFFQSSTAGNTREKLPEEAERIGVITQYVEPRAFLGDLCPIAFGGDPFSRSGISLSKNDQREMLREFLEFIQGAWELVGEIGILPDLQNDNVRFMQVDGRWKLRYIDSFDLYDLGVSESDGAIIREKVANIRTLAGISRHLSVPIDQMTDNEVIQRYALYTGMGQLIDETKLRAEELLRRL